MGDVVKVGVQILLQASGGPESDQGAYREELHIADLAEPLGFDSIWGVEHHFSGYSMCPNVLQFLAYMAGRTQDVQLGSMVVVLPWHEPVRVAGEVAMLDNLCEGRFVLGIGRGLGRLEFEGLGIPMDESRERFVEAAQIVMEGLESGRVEFDGKHYRQAERVLRPRPTGSFRGRTYAAAVSPESLEIMARLGVAILIIPQKPWPAVEADLETYREAYRRVNDEEPPPTLVTSPTFCDADPTRAEQRARHYIGSYYRSVMAHYELTGDHLRDTKGYEFYAANREAIAKRGEDKTVDFYVDLQVWGTPDQCYEKARTLRERVDCDWLVPCFHFAGMPVDESERSMRLFAAEVLPRLKALD